MDERKAEIDFDKLATSINPKTTSIWFSNPSNPSGTVFQEKELRKLVDLCIENQLYLISDEVYSDIIYEKKHVSPASFGDEAKSHVITIKSFSKTS